MYCTLHICELVWKHRESIFLMESHRKRKQVVYLIPVLVLACYNWIAQGSNPGHGGLPSRV